MYTYLSIKEIHIELSSFCNANCPMCISSSNAKVVQSDFPKVSITLNQIKKFLSEKFIKKLKLITVCGNYGDPIMAKDALLICQYFKKCNPDVFIKFYTNGSGRSVDFWKGLASVVDLCIFSIDGLEDTNHIYRRGTDWKIIIDNSKTFVKAGGQAVWEYLVFRHNENQIAKARKLSKKLGFIYFRSKKTSRFSLEEPRFPVYDRDEKIEYYLEMPVDNNYQNISFELKKDLENKFGSYEKYLNEVEIDCKVQDSKSIYISSECLLFPCCWISQIYNPALPPKSNELWRLIDKLPKGIKSLSLEENSIEDIVHNDLFQTMIISDWKDSRCLKVCPRVCGKDLDPFRNQYK